MVKRKDWETARAAIDSLTFDRLAAAAKSVQETGKHSDDTIRLLEHQIQNIASQVQQSFGCALTARVLIQAYLVSNEIAAV